MERRGFEDLNNARVMVIHNSVYHIDTFDNGKKEGFKKGTAYIIHPFDILLPFFGTVESSVPGIYGSGKNVRIILPLGQLAREYRLSLIKQTSDEIFATANYNEVDVDTNIEGDIFAPVIKSDDDLNMKAYKIAMNLKESPNGAYDERIRKAPIGKVANSRKSNYIKTVFGNNSLAATKLIQFGEINDLSLALVIASKPGTPYPMKTDGRPIVLYGDTEFDIGNAINARQFQDKLNISEITFDETEE